MSKRSLLSKSAIGAFTGVVLSGCSSSVYYMDDYAYQPPMPIGHAVDAAVNEALTYEEPATYAFSSAVNNAVQQALYEMPAAPTPSSRYVDYRGQESAGTILVNLQERKLYYIEGNGLAIEYPIAVGRQGSMGIGAEYTISRKAEWPSWYPTQSMRERNPSLPVSMPGGPSNPLGAAALYLGDSLYRIHGTNDESSIGSAASAGCIRMYNRDIQDLYARARTGASVRINLHDSYTPGISAPTTYARPVLVGMAPS